MACITEVYHEELALLRYDIEGLHYQGMPLMACITGVCH